MIRYELASALVTLFQKPMKCETSVEQLETNVEQLETGLKRMETGFEQVYNKLQ